MVSASSLVRALFTRRHASAIELFMCMSVAIATTQSVAQTPVADRGTNTNTELTAKLDIDDLKPIDGRFLATSLDRDKRARLVELLSARLAGSAIENDNSRNFVERGQIEDFERVIDDLLTSSSFGNQFANRWTPLDGSLPRTTATNDNNLSNPPSDISVTNHEQRSTQIAAAYREWLAKRFQNNASLKEMVTWQIAGDLLPNATDEQRFATAWAMYHNRVVGDENAADESIAIRWRNLNAVLFGNNAQLSGDDKHLLRGLFEKSDFAIANSEPHATTEISLPTVLWWNDRQRQQRDAYQKAITSIEQAFAQDIERLRNSDTVATWHRKRRSASLINEMDLIASFGFDEGDSNQLVNLIDGEPSGALVSNARCSRADTRTVFVPGDGYAEFPKLYDFGETDEFSFVLEARFDSLGNETSRLLERASSPSGTYAWLIDSKRLAFVWYDSISEKMFGVRSTSELPINRWLSLSVTCDGVGGKRTAVLYCDGERLPSEAFTPQSLPITHRAADVAKPFNTEFSKLATIPGTAEPFVVTGRPLRLGSHVPTGTMIDDFNVFRVALTDVEMRELCSEQEDLSWDELETDQREIWIEHYARRIDPQGKYQRESLQYYAANLLDLSKSVLRVPVLSSNASTAAEAALQSHRNELLHWVLHEPNHNYAKRAIRESLQMFFPDRDNPKIDGSVESDFVAEIERSDWKMQSIFRRIALSRYFIDYATGSENGSGTKRGTE